MSANKRHSPISFSTPPSRSETRDGFEVVLEYEGEGPDPVVIDLSHRLKWDLQAADLDGRHPFETPMPAAPGQVGLADGIMVLRLNRTQAAVWDLGPGPAPSEPGPGFTEITDGQALVALLGPGVFDLMARLTRLDLRPPGGRPPFVVQGPVLDIPCQIVVLDDLDETSALLLSCARGWGQTLVDEIMARRAGLGLVPGGERLFTARLARQEMALAKADRT